MIWIWWIRFWVYASRLLCSNRRMRCEQSLAHGGHLSSYSGMLSLELKSLGNGFACIQALNSRQTWLDIRRIHSHSCTCSIRSSGRRAQRWLRFHGSNARLDSVFSPARTSCKRRSSSRESEDWRISSKRPRRKRWWKQLLVDNLDWWREHNDDAAMDDIGKMMLDDEEVQSWKRRVDELKRNSSRNWEDWLDDSRFANSSSRDDEEASPSLPEEIEQELLRKKDEELEYLRSELDSFGKARKETGPFSDLFQEPLEWHQENKFERGFARSAAKSTVKFVACLILLPWFADFVVHDCMLVPFLKRYVELVPFAARAFDVTDSQMLKRVIPPLEDEEKRLLFEARIGLAPPISEDKLQQRLHDEALEAIEEVRAENRSNFANLWSDMVAGVVLLLLLILNPVQVELMSYSGIRLFSNLSDIGKAFFIILLSDIFLGYHSESGWVTVVELFLEHYGMKATEASISSFVAIVPVTIDACFKLWVFRNLPRLSPSLTAIFREMERH